MASNMVAIGSPLFFCAEPQYTQTEYAAEFPHWPRVLNCPPAAQVPINKIMAIAQSTATSFNSRPESWGRFKELIQTHQSAGHQTVELVSREVFETAKTHLGIVHWKLYSSIEVMQQSAVLTGVGAALITIGALGVYLTQPKPVVAHEAPKRSWTRILSYGSLIVGLAMVVFVSYRLQSSSNLLMKNFEISS